MHHRCNFVGTGGVRMDPLAWDERDEAAHAVGRSVDECFLLGAIRGGSPISLSQRALGLRWARAGHDVLFGSRDLRPLAARSVAKPEGSQIKNGGGGRYRRAFRPGNV